MKLFLIPLLAALTQAASVILAKVGLTRYRISLRDFIPGLFLFLSLFSALSLFVLGGMDIAGFMGVNLLVLAAIVGVAVAWNVLYYMALRTEKANTSEGILILMPLVTIAVSWLFDPASFNGQIAATATVATLVVMWTYHAKKSFRLGRDGFMLVGAVLLMAIENVLVAGLLQQQIISPATLYAIRAFVVFVVVCAYYRPSFKKLKPKTMWFLAFSGLVGATAMLLRFYGLRDAGVTLTALALILTPVFVFSGAILFLRERIKPGRLLAMVIVGCLVIYATLLDY